MLKKRIIPCLDIKNGRTVKGINFKGLVDAGDPVELAKRYATEGADELVFLDITATIEGRRTFVELVKRIARNIDIPFTVGGGISTADQAKELIKSGADKISINSSAVRNPELISDIAASLGTQCVVVAIDSKNIDGSDQVFTHGGRKPTGIKTKDWIEKAECMGAGEILLTSMDRDGTKSGFDIPLLNRVCSGLGIPVIASGGAGHVSDFVDVFQESEADAALAASLFHYRELSIEELKNTLINYKIPVRCI